MSNETSRREFLSLSWAALAAARLGAFQTADRRLFAYVGRRTRGGFPGGGAAAVPGGGGGTGFRGNMSDGALAKGRGNGPEVADLNRDRMWQSADGRCGC